MANNDWVEFGNQQCCSTDTALVPPGGIGALPPVCSCKDLFDDLAPVPGDDTTDPPTPATPLTPAEQNAIIAQWMIDFPTRTPAFCCAYRAQANDADEVEFFDNAENLGQWCDCTSITGPVPSTDVAKCCPYQELAGNAGCVPPEDPETPRAIECPAITPCPECPVAEPTPCESTCAASGCVKRVKQTVEITDLESQKDTIISIAGNEL